MPFLQWFKLFLVLNSFTKHDCGKFVIKCYSPPPPKLTQSTFWMRTQFCLKFSYCEIGRRYGLALVRLNIDIWKIFKSK